jgi:hypothetical protein
MCKAGIEHGGKRAISTAMGYNQLLTTNSVELMAEQGHEFVKELTAKGREPGGPRAQGDGSQACVLKKMVAFTRTVPDDWSAHEKLANTAQGWAVHAMVLDIDVGPMLQTHKLLTSVIFARAKGYNRPLTAAELEMMNLTGDGTGLDMVTMPQAMREQVPTSNSSSVAATSATPWRSATTRWRNCLRSPTSGWTATAPSPAPGNGRSVLRACSLPLSPCGRGVARTRGNAFVTGEGSVSAERTPHPARLCAPPSPTRGEGRSSIRAEHELAVALEIGAAAHIELSVLADEKQGALRHLLGALQKRAGIVGAHLVHEGLAVLA